jgi:hypothetical protein
MHRPLVLKDPQCMSVSLFLGVMRRSWHGDSPRPIKSRPLLAVIVPLLILVEIFVFAGSDDALSLGFKRFFPEDIPESYSLSRPCARSFAEGVLKVDRKKVTDRIECVRVPAFGQYGNHIIQIVASLAFCLIMNLKYIYGHSGFLWLYPHNFTTVHGIHVSAVLNSTDIPIPPRRQVGLFWYFPSFRCPDFSYTYLLMDVREHLLRVLPPVTVDPDMAYLYLRGGNAPWDKKIGVDPLYAQPPCSFYLDVMHNFTKSRVLGGDLHPCREILINEGAQWEPFDDRRDMSLMVYSRYVALAFSSRSHAALALSPHPKQFWVFDQVAERLREPLWWSGYSPLQFGHGMHCVPSMQHRDATYPWKASPEQIGLILKSKCHWEPMRSEESFKSM